MRVSWFQILAGFVCRYARANHPENERCAFRSYDFRTVFVAIKRGGGDHAFMVHAVLIADDDRTERRMAASVLKNSLQMDCIEAADGSEVLARLAQDEGQDIALVLLDLEMPVMGGLDTLKAMGRKYPHVPILVLTASTSPQDAVQAMKLGAADFLSKPLQQERLAVSARNALRLATMSREIKRLKRRDEHAAAFSDLIGHDGGLVDCVATGRKAASCDLPVLITGETGTGKEIFAGAVHGESARAGHPFIAINCGAIPEKLVESTLFGHEKGAFTGAVAKSAGKFQEANGGTVFLDEVGELPLEAQVKLLRVLQEKEVEPVGAGKSVPVDVRIISATNRDLAQDVRAGRFREDLYFRLNVIHIDIPSLRARTEDIPALARHFIDRFCAAHSVSPKNITGPALARLKDHAWPGNVRELENVINSAMVMNEGSVLAPANFSFPQAPQKIPGQIPLPANAVQMLEDSGRFKSFRAIEKEVIALALRHHNNNISATARALGIAKSTLYAKIGTIADREPA